MLEGEGGVPVPDGARIKCWEQAPSTAPRMREAKAGAPTARRRKRGSTQESVFPSVSYASSKIRTHMAIGQSTPNGWVQTASSPSR